MSLKNENSYYLQNITEKENKKYLWCTLHKTFLPLLICIFFKMEETPELFLKDLSIDYWVFQIWKFIG